MKLNEQVGTMFGTIILVIIAITAGAFVWVYEKNQSDIAIQPQMINGAKNNQAPQTLKEAHEQPILTAEEYPTVLMQPSMTLEETIRQALYRKVPDWKAKNYTITVTVETNERNHAIGRFIYDGYNVIKDGSKHHNTAEGIWFSAESDAHWTLTGISYTGYWGTCQDFQKYGFPKDMIPDCWDTEKNILVDTSNPQRFYSDGFTKADKTEIIKSFLDYYKKTYREYEGRDFYLNKNLYLKIDKNTDKHFKGRILVGGIENRSTPYALAVKENRNWKFIHQSQDIPPCSIIEPYKFPHEIVGKCYDEINKEEKEIN